MIRTLLLKNQKPKKPKPIIFWNRIQSPWPVISYGIWLQFTFLSYLCLSPFFCLPLSPVTSTSLLFFAYSSSLSGLKSFLWPGMPLVLLYLSHSESHPLLTPRPDIYPSPSTGVGALLKSELMDLTTPCPVRRSALLCLWAWSFLSLAVLSGSVPGDSGTHS